MILPNNKLSILVERMKSVPLLRESGLIFFVRASAYAIAFLVNIFYARILGVDEFTTYIYALSWLPLLQILSLAGSDSAILKFVPQYLVTKEWKYVRGLLDHSFYVVLANSLLVGGAFYFLMTKFPVSDQIEVKKALNYLVFVLPLLVYFSLQYSFLRVLKQTIVGTALQEIARPLLQLVIVVVSYYLVGPVTASSTLLVYGMTMVLAILCAHALTKKNIPVQVCESRRNTDWRLWISVSVPMFAVAGFQLITATMDVLMLGYLVDTKTAGIYGVATKIAALGSFGFSAIALFVVPTFSELHAKGDKAALQKRITDSSRLIFLSAVVFTVLISVSSTFLLGLFGEEYVPARTNLLILLFGHLFIGFAGAAAYVLAMTGHHKKVFLFTFLAASQNVVLNYILIGIYGDTGAAVATVYTQIFSTSAMVVYLIVRTGLNTTILKRI